MNQEERHALVRLKIERADKHIADLKAEVQSFFASAPYKVSHKRHPETRKLIYYVESVQPVPIVIAGIAGDALHCLRDSLDHLAQQLYLAGSNNAKGYRDETSFPIAKKAKDFKSFNDKMQGMRKAAVDAIRALEPYPGGKGADLYVLHRLNNIDKHRLILTVGAAFRSIDLGAYMMAHLEKVTGKTFPPISAFFKGADKMFPLKAGDELLIGAVDDESNEKMGFRFDVAVNEPGLVEGEPVLDTVVTFRNRISDIVDSFKPLLA